ncbi:hypothetical protein [Pantoea sp. A4]|uniref:hypothetical protein n=1 Tax=Pantoea sp. A4 TaxID=1225184 RepID=UPI0003647B8B|nr:hypothetical protein [Pantoea sp. A4]
MTFSLNGNPYAAQDRYEELRWQRQYEEEDVDSARRECTLKVRARFPDNVEDALPGIPRYLLNNEYAQAAYARMVEDIATAAEKLGLE